MRHGSQVLGMCVTVVTLLAACGGDAGDEAAGTSLTGSVQVDGSSTVFPISEAVGEEFQIANPGVRVTVGVSGTGGGFKRFCAGETDVSNASRPISETEMADCGASGVRYLEIPVALDGLSIIVHPTNTFATCLTVAELERIWEPGSTVTTWRDVRAEWPSEEIKLYGPGTDSGTFDYFTEVVVGEVDASRSDYQASEDDNVLVQGVAGDPFSLGYFGYAYFQENAERLKLVEVDGGSGCVLPTETTISDGTYTPLSRPLLLYVNTAALARPEVKAFIEFHLSQAADLIPPTGYLPLGAGDYQSSLAKVQTESP